MSEPTKNPFDLLVEEIRAAVREELRAANGPHNSDKLLTPEEVAEHLGVSPDWVYHHHKKLPFTRKLGPRLLRFSHQAMLKWLESKKFGSG